MSDDTAPTLRCWCGERETASCFRTRRFGLVRCTSCRCYRIDPPPIARTEELADFYTRYYAGALAPPSRAPGDRTSRFWRVVDRVPALGRPGPTAIDIGCGEGRLCAELLEAGWRSVVGFDVSRSRVERARKSYPQLVFHDQPIEGTDLASSSVDLLVMDNVIEHLADPLQMLSTLRPYLADEGRLVLITPNMESGHFRLLGRRWTPELAPHAHIFLFTAATLTRLLHAAGFEVRASGSFHLAPLPPRSWRALVRTGDVKTLVWTLGQEAGGLAGRMIGEGPMLYVVAERASARQ